MFSFRLMTFVIKRRRRDLNPRAAINDLLPFQGSPFSLLGTSPKTDLLLVSTRRSFFASGEGGIRTHVPLRTTAFRVILTIRNHSEFYGKTKNLLEPQNALFSGLLEPFSLKNPVKSGGSIKRQKSGFFGSLERIRRELSR